MRNTGYKNAEGRKSMQMWHWVRPTPIRRAQRYRSVCLTISRLAYPNFYSNAIVPPGA